MQEIETTAISSDRMISEDACATLAQQKAQFSAHSSLFAMHFYRKPLNIGLGLAANQGGMWCFGHTLARARGGRCGGISDENVLRCLGNVHGLRRLKKLPGFLRLPHLWAGFHHH